MTKDESKMMQGVAILLMLYLHLFNQISNVNICVNFLHIGGSPLAYILTRASSPVAFFLILSGYGLFIVENGNHEYNILKKINKLYIHYWVSLLIFVPLGAFVVGTQRYPGNWVAIISNVTAWHTTWNGEIWFFFPYMLLALSSKFLFRIMNKANIWLFMGGTLFFSLAAGFCISRYGDVYFYHHQLPYMLVLYLNCLFAFVAGAWMAKYNLIGRFKNNYKSMRIRKLWIWLLFVFLVLFRCSFDTGAFHTFYAIAFIIFFVNAPRRKWVDSFLIEMGKRSTSIWFVHTYFCYYLFQDFIYGFKYPLVIFIVLLICSYLSAIVIDTINKKIQLLIK